MDWILLVRIAIWSTFFLLIIAVVAGYIFAHRFYVSYVRKHRELELRVELLEQQRTGGKSL